MARNRKAGKRGIGTVTFTRIVEYACRWFAGLIFIYASLHKIMNPCQMAMDIYHYRLFPGVLINLIAIALPFLELILGLCLIVGFLPRGAALGISLILSVFMIVLTINLIRGIDFTCGCFSAEGDWCEKFADWYAKGHPGISRIGRIRLRTACDIVRDVIFLVPSLTAFFLLKTRLRRR
jgi:Methylamine utilisation protein MauE